MALLDLIILGKTLFLVNSVDLPIELSERETVGVSEAVSDIFHFTAEQWSPDLDLFQANASFIGEDASDQSAFSITGVGDVNADGFDDILIGAWGDDDGGTDAGKTYLLLGRPSADWQMDLDLSLANASFIGEDSNDWSGYSVAGAGDVNADGYDDILIGVPNDEDGGVYAGQTYLFLGRPSADWQLGLDLSLANASFIGEDRDDFAGFSIAGVGDVNTDGYDDIMIGAPGDDNAGLPNVGQCYLLLGRPSADWQMRLDLSQANASFIGEDAGDEAGYSVAGAGDVNADGYADVLIGAHKGDIGGMFAGQSYLLLGRPSADWQMDLNLSLANASFIGEDAGDEAGFSVAGVGDVNADGYDDILIGAYGDDDGGTDAGQSYLLLGRPSADWQLGLDLSLANASFIGEDVGDEAGYFVAGVGDVNVDGYDDILIGAPYDDDGGTDAGQSYLLLGRPSADWQLRLDLSLANASFIGEDVGDESGCSVAGAGDVNADGFGDLVIGARKNDEGGVDAGQTYLLLAKDYIPPMVDIIDPVPESTYSPSIILIYSISREYIPSITIFLDGMANITACPNGSTVTGLSEGLHNITLVVVDQSNYVGKTSVIFFVDATPPIILVNTPIAAIHPSGTIKIDLSGNGKHYWYNIEGVDSNNQTWTVPIQRTLDDGFHTLHAYGNDSAGNEGHRSVIFTVDSISPVLTQPDDVLYEERTTNHTITWKAFDLHPSSFLVRREGIEVVGGRWDGSSIVISVDNLPIGSYKYTCIVYDQAGHTANDSITVTVLDTTPPTIDHPADLQYVEGVIQVGDITWNPFDTHPDSYTVTMNAFQITSGAWNGGSITVTLDELAAGNYTIVCTVRDQSGNSASDSVDVIVVKKPSQTPWPFLIPTLGGLGLVIFLRRFQKRLRS
ncbi:MAG: hypothetical protein ACFFE8_13900 [Candidatus Heimdallarchaeota archaeon]